MCLLQAAHAVALLVLVVVPFMAHGHLLFSQALVVNLNACGRCRTRCVVSEDIAHVVQQPRGGQQNVGRRQILLPLHAVKEISGVGVAVPLRHGEPI